MALSEEAKYLGAALVNSGVDTQTLTNLILLLHKSNEAMFRLGDWVQSGKITDVGAINRMALRLHDCLDPEERSAVPVEM